MTSPISALVFALLMVCLPRIYSGLHYPSDILVGAMVGALVALALVPLMSRLLHRMKLDAPSRLRQANLTMIAAFMSVNIATMYEFPRGVLISLGLY